MNMLFHLLNIHRLWINSFIPGVVSYTVGEGGLVYVENYKLEDFTLLSKISVH